MVMALNRNNNSFIKRENKRKEIEALGVTCRAYAGNAADFEETQKTVKQIQGFLH